MDTYPAEPHLQEPPEGCPDGGVCHHNCERGCWRVHACAPLSGVYENDEWPDVVVRENLPTIASGTF